MRRGFSRDRRGRVHLRIDPIEAEALTELMGQLLELVRPDGPAHEDPLAALVGIDDGATESDDPALRRLFPAAYRDDEEAAAEFRRFTERSLRDGKVARASAVQASLGRMDDGRVELDDSEAQSWLGSLNDLRLVLAARLEVDDDEGLWRGRLVGDEEGEQGMMLYDWLTWLQDSLIDVIVG